MPALLRLLLLLGQLLLLMLLLGVSLEVPAIPPPPPPAEEPLGLWLSELQELAQALELPLPLGSLTEGEGVPLVLNAPEELQVAEEQVVLLGPRVPPPLLLLLWLLLRVALLQALPEGCQPEALPVMLAHRVALTALLPEKLPLLLPEAL